VRLQANLDTSAHAPLAEVGAEYAEELDGQKLNEDHIAEVRRIIAAAVADGVTDINDRGFRRQVLAWFNGLKALKTGTDKDGAEVVRRTTQLTLSPRTKNRYLGHLKAVTAYAVRRRRVLFDPLADLSGETVPDTIKPTLSVAELRTLLGEHRDPGNQVWLWVAVMIYTGCRESEALHLRWEWIDWKSKRISIKVHADYKLKRQKERTIPLQDELADILRPLKGDIGWIFHDSAFRDANTKSLWQRFRKLLKDAGLTPGDRSPHSARHGYACLMLASREDVFSICRAMGHSDLKMTEHYSRESEGARDVAVKEGWKPGEIRLCPTMPAATGSTEGNAK
jgi:integrase